MLGELKDPLFLDVMKDIDIVKKCDCCSLKMSTHLVVYSKMGCSIMNHLCLGCHVNLKGTELYKECKVRIFEKKQIVCGR